MTFTNAYTCDLVLTYVLPYYDTTNKNKRRRDANNNHHNNNSSSSNTNTNAISRHPNGTAVLPLALSVCCHPYLRAGVEAHYPATAADNAYSHMSTRLQAEPRTPASNDVFKETYRHPSDQGEPLDDHQRRSAVLEYFDYHTGGSEVTNQNGNIDIDASATVEHINNNNNNNYNNNNNSASTVDGIFPELVEAHVRLGRPALRAARLSVTVTNLPLAETGLPRALWWVRRSAVEFGRQLQGYRQSGGDIECDQREGKISSDTEVAAESVQEQNFSVKSNKENHAQTVAWLNAYGVELSIVIPKTKGKGGSTAATPEDFALPGYPGSPSANTQNSATNNVIVPFSSIHFDNVTFSPESIRFLTTHLPLCTAPEDTVGPCRGCAVRFSNCNGNYNAHLRERDFCRYAECSDLSEGKKSEAKQQETHEIATAVTTASSLPYRWESLSQLFFHKCGGAGLWKCVELFLADPRAIVENSSENTQSVQEAPDKSKSSTDAESLSDTASLALVSIHDMDLGDCKIPTKSIDSIMWAIARRNEACCERYLIRRDIRLAKSSSAHAQQDFPPAAAVNLPPLPISYFSLYSLDLSYISEPLEFQWLRASPFLRRNLRRLVFPRNCFPAEPLREALVEMCRDLEPPTATPTTTAAAATAGTTTAAAADLNGTPRADVTQERAHDSTVNTAASTNAHNSNDSSASPPRDTTTTTTTAAPPPPVTADGGVYMMEFLVTRWSRHLTDDNFYRPLSRAGLRVREMWMGGHGASVGCCNDRLALHATL